MDATPPLEPDIALHEREVDVATARDEIERLCVAVDKLRARLEVA